jgi:hypothetical protein
VTGATGPTGPVSGPGSSTNTALARWTGTAGTTLENGTVTEDASGNLTNVAQVTQNGNIYNNHTVTVSSNAGTCSVAYQVNTFTNSSAATMAITIPTTSAGDGQPMIVRIYDFSGVTETIGWTNTENSNVAAPTTSNGSTTLPLTVGFMYNIATSKWRTVAVC